MNLSNISGYEIQESGDLYSLESETIVQIMTLGSRHKTERYELTKRWPEIEMLKAHPTLGNLATLVAQGHPFCVCEEVVLLTFNHTRLRDKANIKANQKAISGIISELLGRQVFVYALDRIDCNKYMTDYSNLLQLNKLPIREQIVLNLPKGE